MKRKLALLLAAVMMLSLLPMNVYAASDNRFSKAPSVVPAGTVFYEDKWQNTGSQLLEFAEKRPADGRGDEDDVRYYVDGTDLLIYADNEVAIGGAFRLRLEGAEWFFRNAGDTDRNGNAYTDFTNVTTSIRALSEVNRNTGKSTSLMGIYGNLTPASPPVTGERWVPGQINGETGIITSQQPERITYNPARGIYYPDNTLDSYGQNGRSGVYVRTSYGEYNADPTVGRTYPSTFEIPYKMEVSTFDAREAVVTILYDYNDSNVLSSGSLAGDGKDPIQLRYPRSTGGAMYGGSYLTPLIRVPLVTRTTGETDVRVTIVESNLTSITNNTYLYGNVGASATNTFVLNPETARTDFIWDQLIIKEERIGSIKNNNPNLSYAWKLGSGDQYKTFVDAIDQYYYVLSQQGYATSPGWFTANNQRPTGSVNYTLPGWLTSYVDPNADEDEQGWGKFFTIHLPTGFEFNMNLGEVELNVESGLSWIDPDGNGLRRGKRKVTDNGKQGYPNFLLAYGEDGRGNQDRSVLRVWLYGVQPSTQTAGRLVFEGIGFTALDNSKYGDFDAVINRGNKDGDMGITTQSFKAGTRADWTILLKAISEIPTLVNGRYDGPTYMTARDDVHKTAKVQFGENSVNAWWSERDTYFYLPDGVKFRRVEVTKAENFANEAYKDDVRTGSRNYNRYPLDDPYRDTDAGVSGDGVYIGDATKRGAVTVDGSEMTWTNLALRHNKRGLVEMDLWVSIRSGFEDDVTLGVRGSAIPDQPGEVPPIVIARSVTPITVDTRVTDILIGYQDQKTNDVIIKETAAGMLQRNKEVLLSITDMISSDMRLSPTTTVNVTDGDLRLKDIGIAGGSSNYGVNPWTGKADTDLGSTGGTIAFKIDRASSVASTITLSNVSVKIDRTVPLTNDRPYMVVVWGDAIAANFGSANNDMFPAKWAGVMADYIAVVSSANDESSILTNEVWVTIGDTYYVVNGKTMDMDAAAYVSEASNSTMVPLRFLSEALGIAPENIIWIDNGPDDRHVVINAPNRVLRFTIGSSTLISNGTPILMLSPDNLEVSPEIKGDRTYVPFRAVGEAFGVPVSWDSRTKTAKYNEGRYKG